MKTKAEISKIAGELGLNDLLAALGHATLTAAELELVAADLAANEDPPLLQQEQKVGSRGRITIWNKVLNAAGFTAGTAIDITHNHTAYTPSNMSPITIKPAADGKRKVSRCVNHGKELPVIDLKHTKALPMADLFTCATVTVTIHPNLVTIHPNQ